MCGHHGKRFHFHLAPRDFIEFRHLHPSMAEESGSSDSSSSNNSGRNLSGKKAESISANLGQKSGGKNTEGGSTPSADGESIPSSVDADASSTAEGSDE